MIAIKKYNQMRYTPSDINEHLSTLYKYADGCETVVEMGVRCVVSTWAFLAAKPQNLISVDIVRPDDFKGSDLYHGDTIASVEEASKEINVNFQFKLSDSRKIKLPEHDLLFIDTQHNYELLKEELMIHSPKTKKFIILHDTTTFGYRDEQGSGPGLIKALNEFLQENQNWKVKEIFTNNNGLTVIHRIEA